MQMGFQEPQKEIQEPVIGFHSLIFLYKFDMNSTWDTSGDW